MNRSAWWIAVIMACGCQTPEAWNAWKPGDRDDGNTVHSSAHKVPRGSPWLKPQETDSPEWLRDYARDQDNANLRNPGDREALRQARVSYERLLEGEPGNAFYLHRLGTVADREGRYSHAETYYRAALHANPNNADLLSDLGYSYLLQTRYQESEQVLQQALRINPKLPVARVNLGVVYAHQGRQKEAYETLRLEKSEAETQALLAQISRNPAAPPALAGGSGEDAPAPTDEMNETTRKVYDELMKDRERRKRFNQAAQRTAAKSPLNAPSPWNNRPNGAAQPGTAPDGTGVVDPPHQVPPEQWNSRFAEIDRQGRSPPRNQVAQANYETQAQAQRPVVQATGVEARWYQETSIPPRGQLPPASPSQPGKNAADAARMQAARLGMQAGGGTLFATQADTSYAQAPRQTAAGDPRYASQADPRYASQDPRAASQPDPRDAANPSLRQDGIPPTGPARTASAPGPDDQAEIELLNSQVLQLQDQINQLTQRRPDLAQERPAPESLPPAPTGW